MSIHNPSKTRLEGFQVLVQVSKVLLTAACVDDHVQVLVVHLMSRRDQKSHTQRQIVASAGAGDLALVTTVSSMMPPFSLVMTDREPVLSAKPAMSPTTSCSMNFTVSLPCEPRDKRGSVS